MNNTNYISELDKIIIGLKQFFFLFFIVAIFYYVFRFIFRLIRYMIGVIGCAFFDMMTTEEKERKEKVAEIHRINKIKYEVKTGFTDSKI